MPLCTDKRGIEGYPLQLMIVVIILAVSLPIIFSAFDSYKKAQAESATEVEVRRIADAIIQTYNQGLGARTIIEIEFPDYVEYVKIGSNKTDKTNRCIIKFKIYSMIERYYPINDGRRSVITEANFGDCLTLTTGTFTLQIEKKITSQDLDGDGIRGDYYIEVKKL